MALISPSKVNIQEANKHLQMLHARVTDLERALTRQANEFVQRDQEKQIHFEELLKIKDAEIRNLKEKNRKAEDTISELKLKIRESEKVVSDLHDKSRVFDEIMQCKPILESMVKLMNVYQSCEVVVDDTDTLSSNDQGNTRLPNGKTQEVLLNGDLLRNGRQMEPGSPHTETKRTQENGSHSPRTRNEMYL